MVGCLPSARSRHSANEGNKALPRPLPNTHFTLQLTRAFDHRRRPVAAASRVFASHAVAAPAAPPPLVAHHQRRHLPKRHLRAHPAPFVIPNGRPTPLSFVVPSECAHRHRRRSPLPTNALRSTPGCHFACRYAFNERLILEWTGMNSFSVLR